MRKAQKEYFKKKRTLLALQNSKALEAEIDREIERVNRIVSTPQLPKQTNLFNND